MRAGELKLMPVSPDCPACVIRQFRGGPVHRCCGFGAQAPAFNPYGPTGSITLRTYATCKLYLLSPRTPLCCVSSRSCGGVYGVIMVLAAASLRAMIVGAYSSGSFSSISNFTMY